MANTMFHFLRAGVIVGVIVGGLSGWLENHVGFGLMWFFCCVLACAGACAWGGARP